MQHVQPEHLRLRQVAGPLAAGEDPRPLLRDADLDAFVACAHANRLAGLLYAKLALSLDAEMGALRARLRRYALATSLENGRLRKQLESAIRILNAAGIVPALLKGAGRMWNAQTDWQCHPSVDLDVLVAPDEVDPTREALLYARYF